MKTRLRHFARSIAQSEEGVTVVEFAILAVPMMILLIGGLDLAYTSYVRSVMQGALNKAARQAAVENPRISSAGANVPEQVANSIKEIVGLVAVDADIEVTQSSFFDFSRIGNPERLMRDVNGNGRFDAGTGDCWEDANFNGSFDTDAGSSGRGGATDVVFYKADISMPRLFPLHAFTPVSPTVRMSLETAVRNQPYTQQRTPPTLCSDPVP